MTDLALRPFPILTILFALTIAGLSILAAPVNAQGAQDMGRWVLWKGSDQAGGDKMYLHCTQNGLNVINLSGLKYFSEYMIDNRVDRVRFKYNQDMSDDPSTYHVVNVSPITGTLCEWGMAE